VSDIDSKNLLVFLKSYARSNPLPLDADEVHSSYESAQQYAAGATAYAGQTIKALVNGQYKTYVLDGDSAPYTLTLVGGGSGGDVDPSQLKTYVQIVTDLPEVGAQQGVLYIAPDAKAGYIYNGSEFQKVFEDVQTLEQVTFSGSVTLSADPTQDMEAATKRYVDELVSNMETLAPGVVDSSNPLPETYVAGETWRVVEGGEYAGQNCEIGDLIICIRTLGDDESASNDDFIVVQANIDGAVVGPDSAVDSNIAVFDGATGKRIKDANVTLASLNDAIAKAHEHDNLEVLGTYTKTQDELVQEATDAANDAVSSALAEDGSINEAIETALEPYVSSDALSEKLGFDDDMTVKAYVDSAVGTSDEETTAAIAQAKQEAIDSANDSIEAALTIQEF
jgi:flavin-binding protein dodecin